MSQGNKKKGGHNKKGLKSKKKTGWGSKLSSLAKGFKPGGAKIHGKPGGGGGNPYGTNNVGMTISAAKKLYANQLAEGISLQDAMKHNKAETISFYDLLDEKNDTKKSNSTNTMALTANQTKLNELYQKNFGRDASFGTKGGANYWLDTHGQGDNVDWGNIDKMLAGSDEGQKHAGNVSGYNKGQVYLGGIDSTKSIASQSGTPGFWGDHFLKGGTFENQNAAAAVQSAADNIGFTPQEAYFNNSVGGGGDGIVDDTKTQPVQPDAGWWTKFADADAFKKFLQPDQKSDGMGDFMKFMMLMNVMRPGGQGGYGGGGSQYGYGGLNPGGVQSAYDPMASLQGMGTWFKDNFGSGTTQTSTVNTD